MKFILTTALTFLISNLCYSQMSPNQIKKDTMVVFQEVTITSKIGVTQVVPQKIRFSTQDLPSQSGGTAGDILKGIISVAMGGSPNHNRDIRYRGLGNGYTTVLINGKQSGITGNNRETVLDMIPATQIDYIEIISNPTAEQTANGINGIVNIVLKKEITPEQNGQISFYADTQDGYNGNISIQHSKNNFSFSGSFDKLKRNANKYDNGTQIKLDTDGSLKETVDIDKSETKSFNNNTASTRINYFTVNGWNFSGEYIFGQQEENKNKEELNIAYKNFRTFKSGKKRFESEDKLNKFYNPSLSIVKLWGKSKLELDLNANFSSEQKNKLLQDYSTSVAGVVNYTTLPTQQAEKENIQFKNYFPSVSFKINFNEKINFKTGFQGFLTNRSANRVTTKLNNTTNDWSIQPNSTFNFDLDENTYAVYLTSTIQLNKFKFILGYRHEFTNIKSVASNITEETNSSNYEIALPNATITYLLNEKSYLKTSLGRRVRRPAFNDMNPFVEIKSATEIKVGNPDLKPEKAWAYELGYFSEIKNFNYGVNVFHRDISDLIQKSITTDTDGITTESFVNLDRAISSGVEFLIGFQPVKWYNINLNYSRFWSEILDNSAFDGDALKDQTDWTFKAIIDFRLLKGFNAQFIANVVGPKGTSQEQEKTLWFADLGLEKQLFTNGFFTVRISDVFDTLKKQKTKNTIVQIEEMTENTPGRIISVGFKWQF